MRTDVLLRRLVEPNFEQSVSKVSRKRISFLNRELYPGVSVFFLHLFKYDLEYYDKFVSIQKSYHPNKISSQYYPSSLTQLEKELFLYTFFDESQV